MSDDDLDIAAIGAEIAASMDGGSSPDQGDADSGKPDETDAGTEGEVNQEAAETTDEEAEAVEGVSEDDDAGDDAEDAADDGPQPLEQWSDERKEAFRNLDADARTLVLDQAKDNDRTLNTRMQEVARERRTYDGLMRALDPVQKTLAENGSTPEQAVETFIRAQTQLQQDPVAGITAIIQRHLGGMPANERDSKLRQIATSAGLQVNAPDTDGDDDYLDPRAENEIAGLKAELAKVTSTLGQMTQTTQQQAQNSQMAQVQAVHDEFRAAKAEDGSPAYPHLDVVGARMGKMFASGYAEGDTLKDIVQNAYYAAVAMDPNLRASLAPSNGVDMKLAKRRSAGATRRTVSEGPKYVSKGNMDDDIKAAMREHGL